MKTHAAINGSSEGLAFMIQADAASIFLSERRNGINLVPIYPAAQAGYVWKRVFLRSRGGHRG